MARYDEGYRYGADLMRHSDYADDFRRSPGQFSGDHPGRFTHRGGRSEPRYWSRPEYNVSFGVPTAYSGFGYDEPYGYGIDIGSRGGTQGGRAWRTGEPWGGGQSDVDRIRARDIMTGNPEIVTPDTPLADVARKMRDLDVGIIPVIDDADRGILQGVITDRDIAIRAAAESANMDTARVADYMSRGVFSVDEGDTVRDIFSVMKRERVRRVPVTDYSGRLTGIIALADLAVDYARLDEDRELEVEELVGRLSEPARPRRLGGRAEAHQPWRSAPGERYRDDDYDSRFRDRLRDRWRSLKHDARHLLHRDHERDWRSHYR